MKTWSHPVFLQFRSLLYSHSSSNTQAVKQNRHLRRTMAPRWVASFPFNDFLGAVSPLISHCAWMMTASPFLYVFCFVHLFVSRRLHWQLLMIKRWFWIWDNMRHFLMLRFFPPIKLLLCVVFFFLNCYFIFSFSIASDSGNSRMSISIIYAILSPWWMLLKLKAIDFVYLSLVYCSPAAAKWL